MRLINNHGKVISARYRLSDCDAPSEAVAVSVCRPQVSLDRWDPGSGFWVFHCGGTLIDHFHVLTAAHCIDKLKHTAAEVSEHHGRLFPR